jgi:hypothetical protein
LMGCSYVIQPKSNLHKYSINQLEILAVYHISFSCI